jgi:4'-phosphopantetheinyl transferase
MRWLARGEQEIPPDDDWLAPAEAARLARYRYTKRRTEYRLRRWAGKQAVAAVAGLDVATEPARLSAIEVLNRPGGAPYVQVDGRPLGVDISLTDRAGWAVCLVGVRTAAGVGEGVASVGVDLELVEPRSDGFVQDFLTGPERDLVRSLADELDRQVVANLVWSAKESALKVLRTGLRADTRSVEVVPDGVTGGRVTPPDRDDGWRALRVRGSDAVVFPGWWRRDGVFVLSVVYDRPADPPQVLPATADLSVATPIHSWMHSPLAH